MTLATNPSAELLRNLAATRAVESGVVTSRGSRRYYVVGEGGGQFRPRFDAALSPRENVVTIAAWEWGLRRAEWAGVLVDEIQPGIITTENAAEWTAAVLCAAAADAGRDRKPGWSRTLTAISEMTGVSKEVMLSHFAQLRALRPTG